MAYDPTIPDLDHYVGDDIPATAANFAELASSRIVEMGSNSNGHYVRWESGLQVCWHNLTLSDSDIVTLPAEFVDGIYVPLPVFRGASPRVLGITRRTTDTFTFRIADLNGTGQIDQDVAYCAIGRWK